MSPDGLIAMLAAALALMGSPGPAVLGVAGAGAAYGFRAALPFALGICLGTCTVVLVIATGVTSLVVAVPGIQPVLIGAAALYILYLAWKIATAPPLGALTTTGRAPSLLPGYLLAVANPKAYAAIGAVFSSSVVVPGAVQADAAAKAAILWLLVFVINATWLRLGAWIAASLSSPKQGRALNIVFAVLLVLSVVAVIWP